MSKTRDHVPPSQTAYVIQQVGALLLLALLIVGVAGLIAIGLRFDGPLLLIAAPLLASLGLPLILFLRATPPLLVDDTGLTATPLIGRRQHIAWEQIDSARPYPLLPTENHEVVRKVVFEGRKRYRQARGTMLIVRGLPWTYRVTGFFAGVGLRPVIAFTTRTHTDYDALLRRVEARVGAVSADASA